MGTRSRATPLGSPDKPGDNEPPQPPRKSLGFARDLALAMELPFIPVAAVVIAGGLGYLMDKRFGTLPVFSLILGFLGFAAGVREIIRRIKSDAK